MTQTGYGARPSGGPLLPEQAEWLLGRGMRGLELSAAAAAARRMVDVEWRMLSLREL